MRGDKATGGGYLRRTLTSAAGPSRLFAACRVGGAGRRQRPRAPRRKRPTSGPETMRARLKGSPSAIYRPLAVQIISAPIRRDGRRRGRVSFRWRARLRLTDGRTRRAARGRTGDRVNKCAVRPLIINKCTGDSIYPRRCHLPIQLRRAPLAPRARPSPRLAAMLTTFVPIINYPPARRPTAIGKEPPHLAFKKLRGRALRAARGLRGTAMARDKKIHS
ncbi:hypothetical protein EVAR_40648_1 [Eumeta japonica]|uniref:Uncharacterized protein n=1 Tax=Eumeta variegata TaxID=151549 RepID=A0A4C1X6X3_EUMVA|nr:hypothetical protein EVAR_40648_1 [Eumeta japonica]